MYRYVGAANAPKHVFGVDMALLKIVPPAELVEFSALHNVASLHSTAVLFVLSVSQLSSTTSW
jgi:hypothetical protein